MIVAFVTITALVHFAISSFLLLNRMDIEVKLVARANRPREAAVGQRVWWSPDSLEAEFNRVCREFLCG